MATTSLSGSVGPERPWPSRPTAASWPSWVARERSSRLYLRRLDEATATPLAGTDGAVGPFFSPDGEWVGFWAGGQLRKIAIRSGPPVSLCPLREAHYGAGWSEKGVIAFGVSATRGLWQVSSDGGAASPLTVVPPDESGHRLPCFLPGGEAVVYTARRDRVGWLDSRIVAQSLRTGARRVLVENGADARYVPTGHLAFLRQGTLMGVSSRSRPARDERGRDRAGRRCRPGREHRVPRIGLGLGAVRRLIVRDAGVGPRERPPPGQARPRVGGSARACDADPGASARVPLRATVAGRPPAGDLRQGRAGDGDLDVRLRERNPHPLRPGSLPGLDAGWRARSCSPSTRGAAACGGGRPTAPSPRCFSGRTRAR